MSTLTWIILIFSLIFHFFRHGGISYSQQPVNPLEEAEYHKNVVVRDTARMFGRQDSSSVGDILLSGVDCPNKLQETPSPESPILVDDKAYKKDYMSPIVSTIFIICTN